MSFGWEVRQLTPDTRRAGRSVVIRHLVRRRFRLLWRGI